MSRHAIPLGRLLGIPFSVDYSWFLIFALLTWLLAASYFPAEFKGWPAAHYWLVGAVTAIMFFVTVLLHELGHAIVARRYNIPVRSITLFIFGGVAQLGAEPPSAAAEFWVAIAGPLVSFGLAAFFTILQPALAGLAPLLALVKYLAFINGTLAVFNLIPGFPLDGGRVFRAILWGATHNLRRATLIAAAAGQGIAYLFIFLGVWQMFSGHFGSGLWTAFIGWFLENAAVGQVQQQLIHDQLAGRTVSQVMSRHYPAISPEVTLQQLVDQHILGKGQRSFIVEQNDIVAGLLTLHHVKEIPRSEWPTTTVAQAMIPAAEMKSTRPETELWAALGEMDRDGVNQLPVMSNGRVVGMLSREDVVSFLRTLRELSS